MATPTKPVSIDGKGALELLGLGPRPGVPNWARPGVPSTGERPGVPPCCAETANMEQASHMTKVEASLWIAMFCDILLK